MAAQTCDHSRRLRMAAPEVCALPRRAGIEPTSPLNRTGYRSQPHQTANDAAESCARLPVPGVHRSCLGVALPEPLGPSRSPLPGILSKHTETPAAVAT